MDGRREEYFQGIWVREIVSEQARVITLTKSCETTYATTGDEDIMVKVKKIFSGFHTIFLLTLRAQDVLHSNKTRIRETNTQVQYCIVEVAAESYKDINVQGTTLV